MYDYENQFSGKKLVSIFSEYCTAHNLMAHEVRQRTGEGDPARGCRGGTMLTREKRMIVFDNTVEGRSPRLYTWRDVCQEATHDPNRETTHHTIWPPAILLGLLHQ